MTVDHHSFAYLQKTNPERANVLIKKLRDVTGVLEEEKLRQALDGSREASGAFNLDNAIKCLIEWQSEERVVEGGESMPPSPAVMMNVPRRPVVDLTDDKDDLQRAIALSLVEDSATSSAASSRPPGVSQEDQDVSKALEASLLDSRSRRRTNEGTNPMDRKRDGDWPVGLKNVGQTCWFSAVIQSFFHLPAFRELVLKFKPPENEPKSEKERKILDFMVELRKLFCLLLASQRKYLDPSKAVGILRGNLGGESSIYCNNQQDVSEFTHKLLDWLEDAFKIREKCFDQSEAGHDNQTDAMEADSEKCDKEKEVSEETGTVARVVGHNPMYDLFYGRVKIEGKNQGIEFSREEQFGQWPLQVNNVSDIHDSVEASTAHEYIDTSSLSDLHGSPAAGQPASVRKSGQERWFTKLPPVLFFELSRFQYNQERGMAEKINNFLDFPDVIYMDRYLEENKVVTRLKREEVRELKEQKEKLMSQLQAYLEYGNDSSQRIPLVNILSRTMQFARSGLDNMVGEEAAGPDPREADPSLSPGNTAMQVDSPCPSPASLTPASSLLNLSSCGKGDKSPLKTLPDGSVQISIKVEMVPTPMEVEACFETGEVNVESQAADSKPSFPTPRYVSELEHKVLFACLSRWRQEIEDELAALKSALSDVETKIREMYNTPDLNKNEFRLHAVMVHEGDVNQGHYWAYVFHPARKVWLKFNDNTVSETTWAAMKKESAGGRMNTSAYSLVYVDTSRPDLLRSEVSEAATRDTLPEDLEEYVIEDNKLFAREVLDWDEQMSKKGYEVDLNEGVLIGDDPECQIIETKVDFSKSHAALAMAFTNSVISSVAGLEEGTLEKIVSELHQHAVKQCREEHHNLDSFLNYVISVGCPREVVLRAIYEQLALPTLDRSLDFARSANNNAKLHLTRNPTTEENIKWHKAYHNLRVASYYFVLGVDKYQEGKFEDSVELLTTSYIINDKLIQEPIHCDSAELKAMPKTGLVKYFHLAVEALNSQLVEEFDRGNQPLQVASRVSRVLVPAIHILQVRTNACSDSSNRDARLLETVRGKWCALLETPMNQEKQEHWSTVFNTVVSEDNSVLKQPLNLRYPKLVEDLNLASKFRNIMQTVLKEEN